MQVTLSRIPSGEAGTDATLRKIGQLVAEALRDPQIRLKALEIIEAAGVPNADRMRAARALADFVRRTVRFVDDPVDLETVQAPAVTLFRIPAGDCDDHSALLAALAMSIGIPARFRVIGESLDHFRHIHPELQIAGQWIPVDTTTGTFGERQRLYPVEKIYDFKGAPMRSSLGTPFGGYVSHDIAHQSIVAKVVETLAPAIKRGNIGKPALRKMLRQVDAGQIPNSWKGTWVTNAVREGLQNAMKIDNVSDRETTLTGLGNLGNLGLFGNIVSAVVSTAQGLITGASGGKVEGVNTGNGDTAEDGLKYGFTDNKWKALLDWQRTSIRNGNTLVSQGIWPDTNPQSGTAYYGGRVPGAWNGHPEGGGDGTVRYGDSGLTIINSKPMMQTATGTVTIPTTTTERIQAGAVDIAGGLSDLFSNPLGLALAGTGIVLAIKSAKKKKGR